MLGQLQALAQVSLKGNPLRQPYLKLLDAKGEQAVLAFLRPDGSQVRCPGAVSVSVRHHLCRGCAS